MKIVIPGTPIAKARHRDGIRNGLRVKYDPQQKQKQKTRNFLLWFKKNHPNALKPPLDCAFSMEAVFYLPIPKNASKTQKNAKLWGLVQHIQKPDASNMLKFYEDAANEIFFDDDKQLSFVSAKKKWSEYPRTELTIMKIETCTPEEVDILSFLSPDDFRTLCMFLQELPKINDFVTWDNLILEEQNRKTAAKIISKLADRYANTLTKISKKFPGYWRKFEDE